METQLESNKKATILTKQVFLHCISMPESLLLIKHSISKQEGCVQTQLEPNSFYLSRQGHKMGD